MAVAAQHPGLKRFTNRQHMVTGDYEYFHYRDDPRPEVPYHNHDFYEVYFFLGGQASYVVEGRTYRLQPGDIMLMSPDDFHMPVVEDGQPYERVVVWLRPDFLAGRSRDGAALDTCFRKWGDTGDRVHLLRLDAERETEGENREAGEETMKPIRTLLAEFERVTEEAPDEFGTSLLRESLLLQLLIRLNRACLAIRRRLAGNNRIIEGMEHNEKISHIIEYINGNLDRNLSLESLSARFYTSRYHLLREFKRHAGCTLHRYIRQKRLVRAREMLGKGLSVAETCNRTGFGDYTNFIRAFRMEFGISPGRFRDHGSRRI
jgi:AraC-like DNA-binding protein/mannose-6-phosphate isomerase-like protein (cupin superfamily)